MPMPPLARAFALLALGTIAGLAGYWTALKLRPPVDERPAASPMDMLLAGAPNQLKEAVDFTLPDLAGRPQSFSQWRGQLVVLNFWATWCPPCKEEIPLFVEMQRTHGDRGLRVVGVAIDEPDEVVAYQRDVSLNYPQLIGGDFGLDLMNRYGNLTGALPFSVVIGPDGGILGRKIGAYQRQELEALLAYLPAKAGIGANPAAN